MWSDSTRDALRVLKEIAHGLKREIWRKTTALSICRWYVDSHALENESLVKTSSRHHDHVGHCPMMISICSAAIVYVAVEEATQLFQVISFYSLSSVIQVMFGSWRLILTVTMSECSTPQASK